MTLRFTLTPRLLTIGLIALGGLLVLLFLLGVELGRQLATAAPPPRLPSLPPTATATAGIPSEVPRSALPQDWRGERLARPGAGAGTGSLAAPPALPAASLPR
jgi:hypothetical protein